MRTRYGDFPEYHTSGDNLDFVSEEGLQGAFDIYQKIIIALELNKKYKTIVKGEPQLGKRGLYPNLSTKGSEKQIQAIGDFIAYANGKNDLIDISNYSNLPIKDFYPLIDKLLEAKLIKICK